MGEPVRIAVNGATGRMGETLREAVTARESVEVVLGIATEPEETDGIEPAESDSDEEIPLVSPPSRRDALDTYEVDVVVDFSLAEGVAALARDCADSGVGLVSGTTGLDEEALSTLETAGDSVPVLHATNFSRGVYALQSALDTALEALPGYDIEVLESHHSGKQDAPSGTATTLLETIADHREFEAVHGREGVHPREESEVGVHVRRAGNIRGEHEVLLADNDEVLTLTHRAEDRAVFAAGALDAAAWLDGREPGRYAFGDVVDSA